jgi:predicted metal-binding transcription factor (methanogenesis marker protein 9)
VEVIQKLYINIPLLDDIQVPTYAMYLRDNLNNKRPLSMTEVIKLTKECSAAILNTSPIKEEGSRMPHYRLFDRKLEF